MATREDINALYQEYLGRDAKEAGINYWLGTIEEGATLDDVEYNISISEEAQQYRLDQTDMLGDTTAEDTIEDTTADDTDQDSYTVITSRAKGDASSPFGGTAESNETSQLVQMTESELLQEFEDSGQLQQQFGSFENYMGYIKDSQEWVQSADWMLANPTYRPGDIESAVIQGEDIRFKPGEQEQVEQNISQDRVNARQSGYQQWMNEGADILEKWGIKDTIYNEDGDQFKWTGSGYQKTVKVDDHAGFADYAKGALISIASTALTGSVLGGPLTSLFQGAGMSSAAASAASQAITNIAAQAIAGGDVDVKGALISAAIGYGGTSLGDIINNSSEIDGVLGSIVSSANEGLAKLEALIETGIPIADAAIQAGGLNMLTQLVSTGDIDLEQAAIAALIAGGSEAVNQLAVASGQSADDLQEITVTATKKGTQVGDNAYMLENGTVISVGSDGSPLVLGKMSDIDLDGDGLLSSSDLQEITVSQQQINTNENIYGDVSFDLPSSGGTAFDYTNPEYLSQFDNFSDSQLKDQLQQAGFNVQTDPETGELYLEGSINSDNQAVFNYLNQRSLEDYRQTNFVDYGNGVVADKSEKYTIGTDSNGNHYIIESDEIGGTRVKFIGESEFEALGGLISQGSTNESIESYLSDKGILTGGNVFTGVNPFSGKGISEDVNDWLTLEAGVNASSAAQVDFTSLPDETKTETTTEQVVTKTQQTTDSGGGATDSSASTSAAQNITSSANSSAAAAAASSAVTNNLLTTEQITAAVNAAAASGAMSSESAAAAIAAAISASGGDSGTSGLGQPSQTGIDVQSADGTIKVDTGGGGSSSTSTATNAGMLTGDPSTEGSGSNQGSGSGAATGASAGSGDSGATSTGSTGGGTTGSGTQTGDSSAQAAGSGTQTGDANASDSSGAATSSTDASGGGGDASAGGGGASGSSGEASGAGSSSGSSGGGSRAGASTGGAGNAGASTSTGSDATTGGNGSNGTGTQNGQAGDGEVGDGVSGTGDLEGGGTGEGDKGTGDKGTGDGTGEGEGDGDGSGLGDGLGGIGLLAGIGGGRDAPSFKPFMAGISYQPLQLPQVSLQQKDYNRELNQMIEELSRPSRMLTNTRGVA